MQQRWTASHIQDVTEHHHLFKIFFKWNWNANINISSKNCDSYHNIYKNNLFFFFFFLHIVQLYQIPPSSPVCLLSNQQSNTQSKSIFIMHDQ